MSLTDAAACSSSRTAAAWARSRLAAICRVRFSSANAPNQPLANPERETNGTEAKQETEKRRTLGLRLPPSARLIEDVDDACIRMVFAEKEPPAAKFFAVNSN